MRTLKRPYVRRDIPNRADQAAYQREYRRVNPDYKRRNNIWNNARHLALEALREKHQTEFEQLLAEKLKEAGW